MLDLFIIGAILIMFAKVFNPFDILEYIDKRVKRFKKTQHSVLFALIDDKGGVMMKDIQCDKCDGKGCTKCAGHGHFHYSGDCTEQCPDYCVKKIKVNDRFLCLGGACTPDISVYDVIRPYIEVLRS